jgi:hypothetical protein
MNIKAHHFYGIRLDTKAYPAQLVDEIGARLDVSEPVASYLIRESAHTVDDPWHTNDELAKKTGIRVLSLPGDRVFLVVASTVTTVEGFGLTKVDMEPMSLEEVLRLEQQARWVGTDVRLGDWFFWFDIA